MAPDFDELEPPRNRPTDPAPARTLTPEDVAEMVSAIWAETRGLSKAIHDINQKLAVTAANAELVAEQMQPMGVRIAGVEERMGKLERRALSGNGSNHPPEATEDA